MVQLQRFLLHGTGTCMYILFYLENVDWFSLETFHLPVEVTERKFYIDILVIYVFTFCFPILFTRSTEVYSVILQRICKIIQNTQIKLASSQWDKRRSLIRILLKTFSEGHNNGMSSNVITNRHGWKYCRYSSLFQSISKHFWKPHYQWMP